MTRFSGWKIVFVFSGQYLKSRTGDQFW